MPDTSQLEETLSKIEIGIRQLKIQYDMFFSGAMPRQPYEVRKELETLIKRLGDMPMQRFADRYRYNSLATRYQSLVELWAKMLRAKEEGRLRPGRAGFQPPPARVQAAPAAAGGEGGGPREFFTSSLSDPAADDASCRALYKKFQEAAGMSGVEGPGRVSYNQFLKQITAKTRAIREKAGCEDVTYSVLIKGSGVTLKAVPGKGRGDPT